MYTQISIRSYIGYVSLILKVIRGHMRSQMVTKSTRGQKLKTSHQDPIFLHVYSDFIKNYIMHEIWFLKVIEGIQKIRSLCDVFNFWPLVPFCDLFWSFMNGECRFIYLILFLAVICVYMLKIRSLSAFTNALSWNILF